MQRTTIMADEDLLARLHRLARLRGVSFAEIVRESLEEKAKSLLPKPTSLGAGSSSPGRTASTEASTRQPPRSWR